MSLLRLLATGRSLVGMKEGISPYRMCTTNLLPNFGATRNPFLPGAKTEPVAEPMPAKPVKPENLSLFDADLKPVATPSAKMPCNTEAVSKSSAGRFEILASAPLSMAKVAKESKPVETVGKALSRVVEMPVARMEVEQFVGSGMKSGHGLVQFGNSETALLPVRLKTLAPMAEVLPPVEKPAVVVEEKPVAPPAPVAPAPVARKVEKTGTVEKNPPVKRPMRQPVKASGFSRWMAKMNPIFLFARWGKVGARRSVRTRPPEQAELLLAQIKPLRNELNDSDLRIVTTTVNPVELKTVNQPAQNELAGTVGPWNRVTKIFQADHVQAS